MRPGTHILYTSGYTQNAIVHNGKLDEDAQLLSKPYRKDELARKLRSVFAGANQTSVKSPPAEQPAGPRGTVLVVEDVALIRMTTVEMVEQWGFATAEAGDGKTALALLESNQAIGILIADLGLPDMDGRQLVKEALKLKPTLKVVIASGYSPSERDDGQLGLPVRRLTKPFDTEDLRKALDV
jgi:CheY-like chemotaxis protein